MFGILPATGETGINLLTIGGGLLLVLGISLVGKGKKKGSGKELVWSKKSSSTSLYFQLLS
ncbi:LPXTG cell wall anchor domain-containing protein [Streptococcus suis]|nr:LPXTG cell wall anchor domain-containing protein [Streptococcus suis]